MRRLSYILIIACVVSSFAILGCGAQKAESGRAAIDIAKTMQTVQEKTNYLISQAKVFYNSKDFQSAVDIAQHVLVYLDKDSQAARDILEKAKEQLQARAKGMIAQATKNLNTLK